VILDIEKLRSDYKVYRKKDPYIAEKIDILISITKFELHHSHDTEQESKHKKVNAFLVSLQLSERTLQRWRKVYEEEGADGLGKKIASGRPPGEIPLLIQELIKSYRSKFRWGSEVLQAHLKYDHDFVVTRHRIERFLDISGLRKEYPCTTIKKQKAQKEKKHTKKVVVKNPGEHTQMDVKYQLHLLTNKKKCYVYNFIDHASNWSFKYAYAAFNERNTFDFMEKLLTKCPFEIRRLQTDNGIEFTFKYVSGAPDEPKEHLLGKFCNDHNINHRLIPPGEKELQGLVERSHRQDDQELFSRINPNELEEFNKLLEEYAIERNEKRRYKKLGWKTPNQWLGNYIIQALVVYLNVKSKIKPITNILDIKKKIKKDDKLDKYVKNRASNRKLAA
jgi:transposase InsO family protein